MITFIWRENGACAYPDTQIEQQTENICKSFANRRNVEIYFCQDIFVTGIQLCVIRGYIPYDKVQFIFEDKIITLNEIAELSSYPLELSVKKDMLREIIQARMNKNTSI